jgi:hypothetical protein
VAVRAVENGDAGTFCRKQVSKAYLERINDGEVAACVKSEGSVPEEASSARATKAALKADEAHAEVTVVLKGGSYDGASGGVAMVRERGAWKLDDYDDEFIRSAFLAAIQALDQGAISTPGMKACFTRQVKTMPIAKVRELTYTSDAEEEKGEKLLLGMAEKCPDAALAEYGATTLTEGVTNNGNHKPDYVKCLYKEFKFLLEVTLFGQQFDRDPARTSPPSPRFFALRDPFENCGG